MGNNIDIYVGTEFGKLTFIKEVEPVLASGKLRRAGLVSCKCGLQEIVLYKLLRRGKKTKCKTCLKKQQCQKKGSGLPFGESAKRALMGSYKIRAYNNNIDFNLTLEEFGRLTSQNCVYCGRKPDCIKKIPGPYGSYTYNTIDRVNNELGYIFSNCVSCCYNCNSIKSNKTISEFKYYINTLYKKVTCDD